MSTAILPFSVWASGTNQNSIPANDNSLRHEILNGMVLSIENDPPTSYDGDIYQVGGSPTGDFSTFNEFDLAIFRGGNWYAFAPADGIVVNVAGVLMAWDGAAYTAVGGGGGGERNTVTAVTSAAGVVTLNLSLGDYFTLTLTEDVTSLLFTNLPGSGKGASITLKITQDSTARTFSWPASFKWVAGSPGSVSTGSGAIDRLFLTTDDNGTTWHASLAKAWG